MARLTALITLLCFSACGGSPTSPGSAFTLTGTVSGLDQVLAAASVTIMDGVHAGQTRTTDEAGRFSFTDLTPAAFTVRAARGGLAQNKAVNLTMNQSVHFQLVNYCSISPDLC